MEKQFMVDGLLIQPIDAQEVLESSSGLPLLLPLGNHGELLREVMRTETRKLVAQLMKPFIGTQPMLSRDLAGIAGSACAALERSHFVPELDEVRKDLACTITIRAIRSFVDEFRSYAVQVLAEIDSELGQCGNDIEAFDLENAFDTFIGSELEQEIDHIMRRAALR